MQIVDIELSHSNFYSPATGEAIVNEEAGFNENARSLIAYWHSEVLGEPIIKNKKFSTEWKRFIGKFEKETNGDTPDYDDLEKFLKNYKFSTWIVFSITTSGTGHGIGSSTVWFVIDMDVI